MITFDTETTDLLRPDATEIHLQPYIIEIYMSKLDDEFNIIDEFEHLIKPPVPISDKITDITGITNDMVRNKPSFIQIYDELCDFVLGETVIAAHNCTFDVGMLKNELSRHNLVEKFPWPKKHICTVEASMPIKNKRLSLEKLCGIAGIAYEKGHRAKHDVIMMNGCIEWLKGQDLI